jgi:YjbE family integral membrane protein
VTIALITGTLTIILINVLLSGDNAVVIAMASRRLPPPQRRKAILAGGAGAIVLRVVFTIVASILLRIPLLQAAGGVMLVWISWRLLREEQDEQDIQSATTVWGAFQTIVVADLLMSLDNILAISGAANGSIGLLVFGLLASMPIILFSSTLIARMMNRLPWLSLVGAVILTITAARMVIDDKIVNTHISPTHHLLALTVLAVTFTAVAVGPSAAGHLLPARARTHDSRDQVV